ncbi:MAG TPA: mannose-6-phosphate isomerase [Verrucomicrobiales bacterium]|jgi:mannose-6-phosphate isomerase|nr:mannose-6-phosphate isomerase [Verrucomicrobiales bacterium]
MLYPIRFFPIFKKRVWGGRKIEDEYQKALPENCPIGESWEISDREEDVSIISNGDFSGRSLHWLVRNHAADLFGRSNNLPTRFPLLIKILDAATDLSVQVHPPEERAAAMNGEPKTEMWYLVQADPDACIYVGLNKEYSREEFEKHLHEGTVSGCIQRISIARGDAMFLPSGRIHAIGKGCLIFEIQQNSDTTYRVFDWNRVGLDGKPRQLHIEESLRCIDFTDVEPELISVEEKKADSLIWVLLAEDRCFNVRKARSTMQGNSKLGLNRFLILAVISGKLTVISESADAIELIPGEFLLLPASLNQVSLSFDKNTEFLEITEGNQSES